MPGMLSKNIARARRAKGWTRHQLSAISGVHENTIFDIERGRSRDPGYFKVEALAKALGTTARELSGLKVQRRRKRQKPHASAVDTTTFHEPLPLRLRREIRTETDSDDYGVVASRG